MRSARTLLTIVAVASFALISVSGVSATTPTKHWMLQKSGVTADLNDITCASTSNCVAVGAGATIVSTSNGGMRWKSIHNPFSGSKQALTSVRCGSIGHCVVVAPPNHVIITSNGGGSWKTITFALPKALSSLGRVACPSAKICYLTASPRGYPFNWKKRSAALYKSVNGGRTWQRQSIPPSVPCPGDCSDPRTGYDLQWISCVSPTVCRAGGDTFLGGHEGYDSAVITTSNGGQTKWLLANYVFDPTYASCGTTQVCVGVRYMPETPGPGPDFMRTTTWWDDLEDHSTNSDGRHGRRLQWCALL